MTVIEDDALIHYGVKGMKWGVRRNLQKMDSGDRKKFLKEKDAVWLTKVKADPKLSKVSRKAARLSKKQIKQLKRDYEARGWNIKKYPLYRTRYDQEMKVILEQSLDTAAYKVHKFPPSRLNEVKIHRHPDGSIDAEVVTRSNTKIVKQFGQIAKADERRAKAAAKEAKKAVQHADTSDEEAPDYSSLVFDMETDSDGFVVDVSVPGDLEHNDFDLENFLEHQGISKQVSHESPGRQIIDAIISRG